MIMREIQKKQDRKGIAYQKGLDHTNNWKKSKDLEVFTFGYEE